MQSHFACVFYKSMFGQEMKNKGYLPAMLKVLRLISPQSFLSFCWGLSLGQFQLHDTNIMALVHVLVHVFDCLDRPDNFHIGVTLVETQ